MSNRAERRGFALPAVLAVTGVVTLVFLVAMTALASLNAEAGSARARVRFLQRAMTAEAMISYLGATEPMSSTGFAAGSPRLVDDFDGGASAASAPTTSFVSHVRLDGRPYTLPDTQDLVLRLQDQGGMINLAALSDDQWRQFAQSLGASPAQAGQAGPHYRDYVDTDSLAGPGGAEQSAYGSQRAANRALRRPSEWLAVLGVRYAIDKAKWRSLRNEVAVDHTHTFSNVNTASAETLEILFGLTQKQSNAAIRARETTSFNSLLDLAAATGTPIYGDAESLYTFPSARVVYSIRDTRSAWTYRARLTLTPTGLEQPVWIDQTELTEAPRRAVANITDATRFPYAPR